MSTVKCMSFEEFLFVVFPLRTLWAVRRHKYWEPEVQYPPDGTTVVDKSKGVWKDGLTDRTRAEGVVEFTELLQALLSINLLKGTGIFSCCDSKH